MMMVSMAVESLTGSAWSRPVQCLAAIQIIQRGAGDEELGTVIEAVFDSVASWQRDASRVRCLQVGGTRCAVEFAQAAS